MKRLYNDISSPLESQSKFRMSCTYKTKVLALGNIPLFFLEVLNTITDFFSKIMSNRGKDNVDVSEDIRWNNKDVKIDGKPIFHHSWYQCRVEKVTHLLDTSGNNFWTYEKFIKTSFTIYYGLLRAVRSKWKLQSLVTQKQTPQRNCFNIEENISSGALHKIIVNTLMYRIERRYRLASTSCMTGFLTIFILLHI